MEILELTALELGKKIKAGEITVKEAVQAVIDRAKEVEPVINSYVTLDEAGAFAQAEEIQKKIDAGELTGPLAGVPVAIKDNMCIKEQLTTCSSKILSNFKPTYTAEAVENLKKAGAVIIGKTNMDEFAMGSTTETSYYGPRRMFRRSRIGHGRFHPAAQFILRRGGPEADLRNCFQIRTDRLRLFAGSDRTGGERCVRLRGISRGDRIP